MKKRIAVSALALILLGLLSVPSRAAEREVSFQTEDGWTISGMLSVPESKHGRVPAVIFLHSYEHDRDAYGQYLYPGLAQIIGGREVATLRIDVRGRGRSVGAKRLHRFSPEELSKLYLDVRAAIAFLASQPGVDGSRLGIVAEGAGAEAAVMGWSGNRRIQGIVLLSGRLSATAKQQIAVNTELPFYLVVSQEDRESFRDLADVYQLTRSEESHISVYKNIGLGTTMFSVWRSERPKDKPLEDGIAEWMIGLLNAAGHRREVTFQTTDGWTLSGTLRTPGGMSEDAPPPAVALIHSSFTDRHIYDHLAGLLVKQGLVVLNFDTRGRGESTGKGDLLSLPPEERNNTVLDAKAAVNYLARQWGIKRIGLLGADRGSSYALQAAFGDPRVAGLVLMTTLVTAQERAEIAKLEIPIFYLTNTELEQATRGSMAAAYAETKNRGSRLLVYPGGALGYDLFEMDETLEKTLAQWLKDQLSR
jgi:dienelactone hydrolase